MTASAARLVDALADEHELERRDRSAGGAAAGCRRASSTSSSSASAWRDADGLRLCSQMRSLDRTRHLPILVLVEPGDEARLLRGLDIGVNDYIVRPIDRERADGARAHAGQAQALLRPSARRLEESIELAVIDPLTGLHNRRYMESHLATLFDEARAARQPLSVLMLDIDHFKASTTPTAMMSATRC